MDSVKLKYTFVPQYFPRSPGVYLMKDGGGRIIYVGKAKVLRNRVGSYFRSVERHTPKTKALVSHIESVEYLLTATEKEALLLEASLIKKHRPRYNVVLRDDKQYMLFRLDKRAQFPRLTITRKMVRDGSVYYGPFISAAAARSTWKLLGKVFPLRKCSDHMFANRIRPCLYHHMKQCLAPCTRDVSTEEYGALVKSVEMFLAGRTSDLMQQLEKDMYAASEIMEFERAAMLRDQMDAIRKTVERQVAVFPGGGDMDAVALAETANGLGLGIIFIRQGRLLDEKHHFWAGLSLDDGPEVVHGFLSQFYVSGKFIPSRIVVEADPDDEALSEVLAERREGTVRIGVPGNTREKEMVTLARKVALRARERQESITQLLAKSLHLASEPQRIECVDASHFGGEGMRVGQVVFEDGKRASDEYRTYTFPELEGSSDDYAALSSWAVRRVESGEPWPDLVLIDGGKGQLAAVERAFSEAGGPASISLASIAKGPSRRAGELEDVIFRPGRKNPMNLRSGSAEMLFLQKIRDAAHRYVISGQRKSRKGKMLRSSVQSLPGVGEKTARLLWDRFGTFESMLGASMPDIVSIAGIGKKRAEKIYEALAELRKAREGEK